eukprot:CAMPEP_0198119204 /NCGR_PEP_ID=MMETSP1442-20131203/24641_1 /TAXON_ID= /ORGANISM="Craspedostauros australis, Strain CCMP3328" /LENGTH=152 /DNA_ID=CAMNT_0043777619 /DNA_START=84 /DNA_END=542 /DNA_ORIENTATION=-
MSSANTLRPFAHYITSRHITTIVIEHQTASTTMKLWASLLVTSVGVLCMLHPSWALEGEESHFVESGDKIRMGGHDQDSENMDRMNEHARSRYSEHFRNSQKQQSHNNINSGDGMKTGTRHGRHHKDHPKYLRNKVSEGIVKENELRMPGQQ